jgi:hypothetical protein
MTIEEFIVHMTTAALIIAVWADVAKLHKKLREVDAYLKYVYSMLYYQHYAKEEDERGEVEEGEDRVKEACVVELISRRGCVGIEEAVELCGVSKSYILNKLYRKRKVVRIDKEGRVCPR